VRVAQSRLARLLALLLALTLLAAACGSDDDEDGGGGGDDTSSEVSGDVFVTGSSTVQPISVAVAEAMEDVHPDVAVDVEGPGTGDGFEKFCNGEADISDASRPIKAEEIETCEANGIEFIELKVAFDGISVLTNPANESLTCLSFADLYALIGPEGEGVDNWKDAQALATELGSTTTFPDLDLEITAPGEESGTYDSFIELALAEIAEARLEAAKITEDQVETTRPDYSSQADDNAIISGIEGADGSLGWVGFAFAEEAGDGVKELEVDGGEGCVGPSAETIADGSYPISRALYIYVNAASLEENPAVAAYVDFYLGDGIASVEEVGYIALPDDQFQASKDAWEAKTTGTRES
jgi:phosphate transport system substrate-binding protein